MLIEVHSMRDMTMTHELTHPNENARLDALDTLHILDTPLEERFERITRLAS